MFSIICWSLLSVGAQATLTYSRIGLSRPVYSFFIVGPSKYENDLLIRSSIFWLCLLPSPLVLTQTLVHDLFAPQVSFVVSPKDKVVLHLHFSSLKRSCHCLVRASSCLRSVCNVTWSD